MAPLRILDPRGLYHVVTRGNFRRRIFHDDAHFERFLTILDRVTRRRRWIVLDWCLIPNHIHLVIQLTDGGLSDGMRELNGSFSRWSNTMTGLTGTGHLMHNRFKHKQVDSDGYLIELTRYVALNPVRAGLVQRPDQWRWSGFRANAGLEHPRPFHRPSDLLEYFARTPDDARRRYRAHVASGLVSWSDQGVGVEGLGPVVESAA